MKKDTISAVKRNWPMSDALRHYGLADIRTNGQPIYCPFHPNTQTPAAAYYDDNEGGHIYCFTEARAFDVIHLVAERERLQFLDALNFVARKGGVESLLESFQKVSEILESFQKVSESFLKVSIRGKSFQKVSGNLSGLSEKAVSFLKEHHITPELALRWRIGLFPAWAWDEFVARWSDEYIARSGLLSKHGNPLFRDRLIFPVFGVDRRPVAFVGRTLANHPAKYVNSSGMKRRGMVFGYHAIRDGENVALVEGATDVIALDGVGVRAVAALGSSARLGALSGRATSVTLLLDADAAGTAGVWKTLKWAMGFDGPIYIASMPAGDPADDPIAAREALASAESLSDWLAQRAFDGHYEDALSVLLSAPPSLRGEAAEKISAATGLSVRAVMRDAERGIRLAVPQSLAPNGNYTAIERLVLGAPDAALFADAMLRRSGLGGISSSVGDISPAVEQIWMDALDASDPQAYAREKTGVSGVATNSRNIARAVASARIRRAKAVNIPALRAFLKDTKGG